MPSYDYAAQVWRDDADQPMPCAHPASMGPTCCAAFRLTGRRVEPRDLCGDCGLDADAHDRRAESGCPVPPAFVALGEPIDSADVPDAVRAGRVVWSFGYDDDDPDNFTTIDTGDLWAWLDSPAVVASWAPFRVTDPDPDLEGLAVELEAEYTAALERRRQLEADRWADARRGARHERDRLAGRCPVCPGGPGRLLTGADLRSAAALSGIVPRVGDPDARARVRELVAVGSFFAAAAAGRDDPDPDAHQRHLDRQHEWSGALWPIELAAG